jgi:hypothetical protein
VFTPTSYYLAVMNPGGSIPFPIWIVIVLALVAVGGVLAFSQDDGSNVVCRTPAGPMRGSWLHAHSNPYPGVVNIPRSTPAAASTHPLMMIGNHGSFFR